MKIGNLKIDKDKDGEIRGFSYEFDEPFTVIQEIVSDEPYYEEIEIINRIQKELRAEKSKLKEIDNRNKAEMRILNKIAELEDELQKLRNERSA